MESMQHIVSQIHTLSTRNDSDLKKLKDYLRHEQECLKTNASHIDQALPMLDQTQHTLGIAFLLEQQLRASAFENQRASFAYIGNFLKAADEMQAKKAHGPMCAICKSYAQMAIDDGQQAMLRSIVPLRCAIQKLRPDPETLTAVHAEYLRVCLQAKAYHLGAAVLDQPIFDISVTSTNCLHMTVQSFLSYFYYGAVIRIGMKDYAKALQLLLVALTTPASCLSQIQADAFKKYALVSLKVNGELQPLPVYASHIVQRYAKSQTYVFEIAEAYKNSDSAALSRVAEEKKTQIEADDNMGLVKQVIQSLQRHKVRTLTKTYMTLSLPEIARELGLDESKIAEVEELLFDMISSSEINARIDQTTGNVSFEDDDGEMDIGMVGELQDKLTKILELAGRVATFESEVVSSEAYIRKTATLEGDRAMGAAVGGYDFMDM